MLVCVNQQRLGTAGPNDKKGRIWLRRPLLAFANGQTQGFYAAGNAWHRQILWDVGNRGYINYVAWKGAVAMRIAASYHKHQAADSESSIEPKGPRFREPDSKM